MNIAFLSGRRLGATPLLFSFSLLSILAAGCGGGTPDSKTAVDEEGNPKSGGETASTDDGGAPATETEPTTSTKPAPGSADDTSGGPKKDECTVFDESNLEGVLLKSSCEVPTPTGAAPDVSKQLVVKVTANPNIVAPGAHTDLQVTFTNKSAAPLPLFFTIDPMPRFDIEAYNAKGNRVDMPKNQPPPLPAGLPPRVPGEPHTARINLAPNGTARMAMGWDAMTMKWAPDKLKGTPPEKGYPRAPAGKLPKGKYSLKVVTPLINVFEGIDREVSQPRVDVVLK
ncbi:MAG TPA: hypothetical protein VGI39_37320 [Polyangiaceae bacterium]|jgi:hypothetical protein